MLDLKKIAPLFSGWEETMIWSCLQERMGYALADDEEHPQAAQIVLGDFCFFAGTPNFLLAQKAAAPIMIPQTPQWESVLESAWLGRAEKSVRYAIKKEPFCFDKEKLEQYQQTLKPDFTLKQFDENTYYEAQKEAWSKDLCSQFESWQTYKRLGLGIGVFYKTCLVSGASSYSSYEGGVEIEIDTHPDFRQKGLATACGAALILECLHRGLYPSWDAFDMRSVALAEKLGYHLEKPYSILCKKERC